MTSEPQNGERDTGLNESPFMIAIKPLVSEKETTKTLELSLQTMNSGLENILSANLVDINELGAVKDRIQETKQSALRTDSILKDMRRDLEKPIQPLKKSTNLGRSKTLGEFDNFLSSMGLYINWQMGEAEIKQKIHERFCQSSHSINVPYSGSVNYSGAVNYSGSVSYSGSAYYSGSTSVSGSSGDYWTCNACQYADNSWSINYCGRCKKLYSESPGYHRHTKTWGQGLVITQAMLLTVVRSLIQEVSLTVVLKLIPERKQCLALTIPINASVINGPPSF